MGQQSSSLEDVKDVHGLAAWLLAAHRGRQQSGGHGAASATSCVLLTAGPAAGKTCLMNQLVMHTLRHDDAEGALVPILIKVQDLQKRLLASVHRALFQQAWNWIDAYLRAIHGSDSEYYQMLRQALLARRALIMLDGLDEGGKVRNEIEQHVTSVLAPQGHVMIVSSRPNGVTESLFTRHFNR